MGLGGVEWVFGAKELEAGSRLLTCQIAKKMSAAQSTRDSM